MFPRRSLPLLALMMVGGVSGVSDADCSYARLLEHLNLLKYSVALAKVRPVVNWTTPLEVMMDLYLNRILEVDQTAQTFSFHTWCRMVWRNEFLTWNASDFCGIDRLAVPREKLWRPDILIAEDISGTSSIMAGPYMNVRNDGIVTAFQSQRLTVTCGMNLYNFPFDRLSCHITFMSVMHKARGIVLRLYSSSDALNNFAKSTNKVWKGEWKFLSMNYTTRQSDFEGGRHQLVYTVTFERRPLLHVMNLLLPLFFFLLLDVASFFISEEKLNFKVTILLSISVLLLILKDIMPSTEHKLPLLAVYCIVVFTLVGCSVLETVLVAYLAGLDPQTSDYLAGLDPQTSDYLAGLDPQTSDYLAGLDPQTSDYLAGLDPQTSDARHTGSQNQPSASSSGGAGQGEISGQSASEIGGQEDGAERGPEAEASPGKRAPDGARPSLRDPRVLEEVRPEGSSAAGGGGRGKPGYWGRLARRIDRVYFCLYLVSTIGFNVYMYVVWEI